MYSPSILLQKPQAYNLSFTFLLAQNLSSDKAGQLNTRLSRLYNQNGDIRVKRIKTNDMYNTDFLVPCQTNTPFHFTVSNTLDGMNDAQTAFKWKRKIVVNGVTR